MRNVSKVAMSVCLSAGCACGVTNAAEPLAVLETGVGRVVDIAHIYYNLVTGEKVVTLIRDGQTAPADTGSSVSIWASTTGNLCSDQGFSTSFFFGVDDNSGTTSLATAITVLDYGDIATDSVVDCVHINWVTDHDDVDTDLDGIGDGVGGLGGQWTFWELENARTINASTRNALVSFLFIDLPGDISGTTDPMDPLNTLAGYSADIDLTGTFSSSLSFEICDTDGDDQGAAVSSTDFEGNGPIGLQDRDFDGLNDSDLDGDGLADWGWTIRFFQPGTADLDGDGIIDGDFADSMKVIGITFGSPAGHAVQNGDGTWTWVIDTSLPDAGTGQEDRFGIYSPPDMNGDITFLGGRWFGGFSCTPDANGQWTPRADFRMQLFGPGDGPVCDADCNGDGVLNFFDVSCFLQGFTGSDCDYNNDGQCNFFDVSAFLADFSAGCP